MAEKVEPGTGLMLRSRIPTFERTATIPSKQPRAGSTPRPGLAARIAATRLIEQVVDNHVALDQLTAQIGGLKEWAALDERDRGLSRAIAVTALRHRGAISAVLKTLLDRPLPKRARHLLHTLHAAAAQILYM
ncbi:MAG: transcription antitermination factor NusB, partial [Parvibaculum sp.]